MTYIALGPRTVTAAKDQTGLNTGNLTTAFTARALSQTVAQYECYHIVVTNVPAGASGQVYINATQYGFTFPGGGGGSEWDPQQPMLLNSGMELDILWTTSATNPPSLPLCTAWFRYDNMVPANANG